MWREAKVITATAFDTDGGDDIGGGECFAKRFHISALAGARSDAALGLGEKHIEAFGL